MLLARFSQCRRKHRMGLHSHKGDVDTQAIKLTETLMNLQECFIPHKSYKIKALVCAHADLQPREKQSLERFKCNPSTENKLNHKAACKRMKQVKKKGHQTV